MTRFQEALAAAKAGQLQTPSVSHGNNEVDYFGYQLSVHKFNLRIMAAGMKVRGLNLKTLKEYYGLKGKTAKDCMPQFEAIFTDYQAQLN